MRNPFLRSDSGNSSFLPQDYVARKAELRANLICLGLFGVVMFGVVAAFFVTNRQWLQVRREQTLITTQYTKEQAKIEQLKKLESQKAEMFEKAEITTALLEKVPRSRLLSELVNRMPQDITLLEIGLVSKRIKDTPPPAAPGKDGGPANKSIAPAKPTAGPKKGAAATKDGKPAVPEKPQAPRFDYTLKLTGVSRVNNSIADYMTALKACAFLDAVELKYIEPTTIEKQDLRKFVIEAQIKKDVDARDMSEPNEIKSAGAPGADVNRAAPVDGKQGVTVKPATAQVGKNPGEE
jgi:Tfp pilus assembly protein PilN